MRCCRSARLLARCRSSPQKQIGGPEGPPIAFQVSFGLARRTRIFHDRAEQFPALAVELHHLKLLVDAVVVGTGVDLHAGQAEIEHDVLQISSLLHDVLAREIVTTLLEDLHQELSGRIAIGSYCWCYVGFCES